jgi:hypothetical protein
MRLSAIGTGRARIRRLWVEGSGPKVPALKRRSFRHPLKENGAAKAAPLSLDWNEDQAFADILATPELVTMLVSLVSRSKSVPMMKLITATMIGYQRP